MPIKELKNINKRPRYFAGQYLLEDDFELEQDYSRDRLQRYTRSLHISGIADGLIVSKPNDSSLKLIVDISAGTAIDPQGRQVVLLESRQVDLTKDLVETVKLDDGFYILSIGYDEQETEPQDGNTSTNRRILEKPLFKLIKFSTSPPSEDSIAIAKLIIQDSIVSIPADSKSIRKYTGLRLPALENKNAPTLRSKGDNLVVFSGSLEIAGTQTVGSTTFESHLSLSGGTGPFAQFYRDAIEGKDYLGIEAFNQNDSTTKTAIVLQEFGGNVCIGGAPASGANAEKLKVAGNTTIAGSLSVTGANNNLTVDGTSTLTGKVGIGGAPATGAEKLKVTGNATIAGTLSVTSTSTLTGNVGIGGDPSTGAEKLKVTGDVAIAGTLSVTSTSTLTGNVGIGGAPSTGAEKLKVTGDAAIAGNLTVAGKYVVQNKEDGGTNRGIFMWSTDDPNWGIYMGTSGNKKSLSGGIAVAGNSFTSHAIRLRTYSNQLNGLIYENSNEELNLSIRASDGRTYIRGNAGVGTDPTDAERLKVGGNTAIAGTLSVTNSTFLANLGINTSSISNPSLYNSLVDVYGPNNAAVTVRSSGGIRTTMLSHDTYGASIGTDTNHSFEIRTNQIPRVTIATNGNVGIGGNPATEKLKVTGDAQIAGNLQVEGNFGIVSAGNVFLMNIDANKLNLILAKSAHFQTERTLSWDGDSNWDVQSDIRLKTDIENESNILSRLLQLDVKNYRWKDKLDSKTKRIGFIAQDVQPLFPALVSKAGNKDDNEAMLTLKYAEFGVLAIGGLKEMKLEKDAEISELKNRLEAEITNLKAQMQQLRDHQLHHQS